MKVSSRGEPAKARPTSSAVVRAHQPGQDQNHLDEQSEARGAAVPHHTRDPTVSGALSLTPLSVSESRRRDLEPPVTPLNVPSSKRTTSGGFSMAPSGPENRHRGLEPSATEQHPMSETQGAAVPHPTRDASVSGALSLTMLIINESRHRDLKPPVTKKYPMSETHGAAVPHHTRDASVSGALSLTRPTVKESRHRDLEPPVTPLNVPNRTPPSKAAAVHTPEALEPSHGHPPSWPTPTPLNTPQTQLRA